MAPEELDTRVLGKQGDVRGQLFTSWLRVRCGRFVNHALSDPAVASLLQSWCPAGGVAISGRSR